MFYKDWKPIYKRIAKDFKFPETKEKKSAETLNSLLKNKKLHPIKHLKELIENKEVIETMVIFLQDAQRIKYAPNRLGRVIDILSFKERLSYARNIITVGQQTLKP